MTFIHPNLLLRENPIRRLEDLELYISVVKVDK